MTDTLIKSWLELVLGYDDQHVIKANGNGPRPVGDFATFFPVASTGSDYDYYHQGDPDVNDDIKIEYLNRQTVSYDVNIYAADGSDLHRKLHHSGSLFEVRAIFQPAFMALRTSTAARDLTGLGDTKFRPRFQSEYTFAVNSTINETNQVIREVELTGAVDGTPVTIEAP